MGIVGWFNPHSRGTEPIARGEDNFDRSPPGRPVVLLAGAIGGLLGGGIASIAGGAIADLVWAATTAVALAAASASVWAGVRRRQPGVDVIAVLALLGTLVVGEYFAGAMIAVMLASGRALEARARARAARDLHALVARAPRTVHRHERGTVSTVAVETVAPGDLLLVKPGEVVPVDGVVESPHAVLDESALTGEPLPVERGKGDQVRSGVVNAGSPFDLRTTAAASASTYAGIVRLAESARAEGAPFVRMADRYAVAFVPLSLGVAGVAWAWSGELARGVAVLVVATPCPLILAAPIAIVAGLSRAARQGVVIKGGGSLEQLAEAQVLLLDKTGTLTAGRPTLVEVVVAPDARAGADGVLDVAASLEQASPHVLAAAVVDAARGRGLSLRLPTAVDEEAGQGIRGMVGGVPVAVGKVGWCVPGLPSTWARSIRRRAAMDGLLTTFVSVDGRLEGALVFDDPIRPDARRTVLNLRRSGVRRIVMVTGDRTETAQNVGTALGLDDVVAECSPADKVAAVRRERRLGSLVMVGDGVNDAPALAAADLGVALAARGSTASSESADVVLTVDKLGRLGEAMGIARRARAIARQSVLVGMTLSLAAMAVATAGLLAPAGGAVVQEAIDLVAILNALRALSGGGGDDTLKGDPAELGRRFADQHRNLWPRLVLLRSVADDLGSVRSDEALARLASLRTFLADDVLPHEEAEDTQLYPALDRVLGTDATASMSRAHVEIAAQIRRLGRILDDLGPAGPEADDITELRRLLYGLYAILRLHFTQEDEEYFALLPEPADGVRPPQPARLGRPLR